MTSPVAAIGRPRDPAVAGRILDAAIALLAEHGPRGLTADAVATRAGSGKAAIYRRWSGLDAMLVELPARLAVRDVVYPAGAGLVARLAHLIYLQLAGGHGPAAAALLALLPYDDDLRAAWTADGPDHHLAAHVRLLAAPLKVQGPATVDGLATHVVDVVAALRARVQREGTLPLPGDVTWTALNILDRYTGRLR